jgi:hypothetical protein
MARLKGGQKIMAMAKASAAKRAARKRFKPGNVTGKPKSELFNASELGGARWERSWAKTRAKNRKMTSGLREQHAKNVAKNKRRTPER